MKEPLFIVTVVRTEKRFAITKPITRLKAEIIYVALGLGNYRKLKLVRFTKVWDVVTEERLSPKSIFTTTYRHRSRVTEKEADEYIAAHKKWWPNMRKQRYKPDGLYILMGKTSRWDDWEEAERCCEKKTGQALLRAWKKYKDRPYCWPMIEDPVQGPWPRKKGKKKKPGK